jgi:hypothetical protein
VSAAQQDQQQPQGPFVRLAADVHEPIPKGWVTNRRFVSVELVYNPAVYALMRVLDDVPVRTAQLFAGFGWEAVSGGRVSFFLRSRTASASSAGLDDATVALAEGYDDGWHGRLPERREEASRGDAAEIYMYGWHSGLVDQEERQPYGWRPEQIKVYVDAVGPQYAAWKVTPHQRVRWKPSGRWRYGHLGAEPVAADGSLLVFDEYNGGARSLRPEDVEIEVAGPRGGRRWVAAPVQEPVTRCARPGCIDRDPGERGVANWLYQNLGDELIPSCWTHIRDAYWWQVKPITEASLPPGTPHLAGPQHARPRPPVARPSPGVSL